MSLVEKHFRKTEDLLRKIPAEDIAEWLLNEGYYPEQYVLPPSFKVQGFHLGKTVYNNDIRKLSRRELANISYPKSLLGSRTFSIQHPYNYHDIVFILKNNWAAVIDHLFPKGMKIFSYSFPIPIDAGKGGSVGKLRSGRMIYEWIQMAEKDLVAEAYKYGYIARADITNYYPSIYTHSIGWSFHGREPAFADKTCQLFGNRIDKLVQYANDARTNGIPIGPALCDLIGEIIAVSIDVNVSAILKDIDFLATRFKDDYRILCKTSKDAQAILRCISEELKKYNLLLNEKKTDVLSLPDGLYRQHDREYYPYSLRKRNRVEFKDFEHTLLVALNIHRKYPGTSILEKFISELFNRRHESKIAFSSNANTRKRQIQKTFSLLFLLVRESEKTLCHVLSMLEQIVLKYRKEPELKEYTRAMVESELERAAEIGSAFEITWLVFFSRYLNLGITQFNKYTRHDAVKGNPFVSSIIQSKQAFFMDSGIVLFRRPLDCRGETLAKQIAVFRRDS